ncbi:DUF305 domain-containing protein [Acrocarpospora pleiomorpha]|uniref:DUF305 domain-containing protein n=1 Tax=Acrocarpospora pleiomorpha TaxID=90975 RepID=A0A5M3XPM8_9ACTN|nr:DUF305 domain-containing protein [Acrocarpospora pleiomorpha]GES23194.1 DUF305 domain-containing protein [Acrocarpospora pleiomorpha]
MRRAAIAVILSVLVAGCAKPDPPAAAEPVVSSTFNATDVAWLQLLIPMTEQALALLGSAPQRTSNAQVIQLAATMNGEHTAQLTQLRELLRRAGVPETDIHDGHDLPGIVTPDDLLIVNKTTGATFDRLFAEHVSDYLRQSVLVAKGEQTSGADRETKAFAVTMAKARTDELAELTKNGWL